MVAGGRKSDELWWCVVVRGGAWCRVVLRRLAWCRVVSRGVAWGGTWWRVVRMVLHGRPWCARWCARGVRVLCMCMWCACTVRMLSAWCARGAQEVVCTPSAGGMRMVCALCARMACVRSTWSRLGEQRATEARREVKEPGARAAERIQGDERDREAIARIGHIRREDVQIRARRAQLVQLMIECLASMRNLARTRGAEQTSSSAFTQKCRCSQSEPTKTAGKNEAATYTRNTPRNRAIVIPAPKACAVRRRRAAARELQLAIGVIAEQQGSFKCTQVRQVTMHELYCRMLQAKHARNPPRTAVRGL